MQRCNLHGEPAVINQETHTRRQRRKYIRMRETDAGGIPLGIGHIKGNGLASDKFGAIGNDPDTVLWTLQIGKDAGRAACCVFHLSDQTDTLSLFGLCAMRKIQAKNIGTGVKQCAQGFCIAAGTAKGGNNLGCTMAFR